MKNLIKILIISIFCSSCGMTTDPYFDPILAPYVVEFQDYMGTKVMSDVIFASELKNDSDVGNCRHGLRNTVLIRDTVKVHMSQEYIMSIVYHELGHCEFGLNHTNDFIYQKGGGSIPSTFMTENIFAPQVYHELGFDYYKQELKVRAGQ